MSRLTYDEFLDAFFRDPEEDPQETYNSPIYLLRRDINICLNSSKPAIWPATLLLFTGFDILASCYSDKGGNGAQFKDFCKNLLNIDDRKNDGLYEFRNALTHDYCLTDVTSGSGRKSKIMVTYKEIDTELIEFNKDGVDYRISAYLFKKEFERGLEEMKKWLKLRNENVEKIISESEKRGFLTWRNDISVPNCTQVTTGSYTSPMSVDRTTIHI
jgi:hypothetical protein